MTRTKSPYSSSSSSSKSLLNLLLITLIIGLSHVIPTSFCFQSDELLLDDEEFGLEGGIRSVSGSGASPDLDIPTTASSQPASPTRRRSSGSDLDSKVQFPLEHAFGDSEFSPAGTFSARLKTSPHGGQTLTKLRFSRNAFTEADKGSFRKILEGDDFYRIRVPSNVLSSDGKEYVISSVKARCLPRNGLDEHFVIHTDRVNILGVNYGSPGSCPYPRQLNIPTKWAFNSHTVLKSSEQAPRTPTFSEDAVVENLEGEGVKLVEKSFWAKYWMYLIPLGLIVMNAITQAMNMAEEPAGGQGTAQQPAAVAARGPSPAVRRR